MALILLLVLIYLLNIIDYCQTAYVISVFGLGAELNPIARFLFENDCAWACKLIVFPLFLIPLFFIIKKDKGMIWSAFAALTLYLLVVIHNFAIMASTGLI